MKFKYLIILIAVASLVILYLLSLITSPAHIPLSALHTYDGQQVVVEGIVTDYRTTSYGSQLITIRDIDNTNYSVTLYIEGDVPVDYGDTLQVTGEVQQYKGQWEILVNNPHFVILLKKWDDHSTPLWHLAENPDAYLGLPLNITGRVTQKHTASCTLTDMTGTYTIDVSYDSFHPHQFSDGDIVVAVGRFLYDPKELHYIMELSESTHGIWRIPGDQDA